MSGTFEEFIAGLHKKAEENFGVALSKDDLKRSREGQLSSSRRWICIQEMVFDHLRKFTQDLEGRLNKYDAEHSPIRIDDFDLAITATKNFGAYCEKFYEEKCQRSSHFGGSQLPLDVNKMTAVIDDLINDLNMHKRVFTSQRSFWKWAWGDLRKRVWFLGWSGVAFALGLVAKNLWDLGINALQ